jgi:PAS domain S-box-containing protein
MEQIAGVPASQAVGRRVDELFDPEFLAAVRMAERDGSSEAATIYRTPLVSRHADGARKRLVNAAMHPLRGSSSSPLGSVLMVEDITSRVQLEEQLQISEKMASIGLLAAGVAHEVNTPLTGISSFTQMLLENADPEDPRTRLLEKIERQTFRAAKIVNSLLHLSRPVQSETGPVDLHVVINDVLSLLEHQFRTASVQVRKDLQADGPMVRAVEHKLQQVFLNLFLNARDAMPKGGWLAIATHRDGDHVVVEVSDTGAGIPAEHLARIYDPFFSTKPIGQGTGLGLSITYGIVQEHDGTIVCDSQVGQGTRFSLSFPRLGGTRVDAAGTGAG